MAGRKPLPTQLKLVKGTARPHRMNPDEPKPVVTTPPPPDHLDERAAAKFTEMAELLARHGVMTELDVGNVQQMLDPDLYDLFADARGAHVVLRPGQSWPASFRRADAVSVTFTAGYGAAADVPEPICQAILLIVQRLFDGADAEIDVSIERTVHALIAPYRKSPL